MLLDSSASPSRKWLWPSKPKVGPKSEKLWAAQIPRWPLLFLLYAPHHWHHMRVSYSCCTIPNSTGVRHRESGTIVYSPCWQFTFSAFKAEISRKLQASFEWDPTPVTRLFFFCVRRKPVFFLEKRKTHYHGRGWHFLLIFGTLSNAFTPKTPYV